MYKDNKLFGYLENILKGKSLSKWKADILEDTFQKSYSKFMVLRYLSMSEDKCVRNSVIESQQYLESISPEIQYLWLLRKVPRQNSSFISYIK